MIYIASPYSHDDANVRHFRFVNTCRYAAKLFAAGKLAFSPIAHSHPIAVHGGLEVDFETWRDFDLKMMKHCDELHVFKLPEWENSKGITAEVLHAGRLGIPVMFIDC